VKAVLDTNVVVSGIFFGGVPGEVLEAWAETRFELCLSPLIIDEYLRTCDRLASIRLTLAHQEVLAALLARGSLVADDITREPVTADPDDDKFMICARKAGAMVVSGDRDLLDASGWQGVQVLTPRAFLALLREGPGSIEAT